MRGSLRSVRATRCSHSRSRARDTVPSHARAALRCARLPVRSGRRPDPDRQGARRRLEAGVRRVPARTVRPQRRAVRRVRHPPRLRRVRRRQAAVRGRQLVSFIAPDRAPPGHARRSPVGRDDRRPGQPQERARTGADPPRRRAALRRLGRLRESRPRGRAAARGGLVEHELPRGARVGRNPRPVRGDRRRRGRRPRAAGGQAQARHVPGAARRLELEPAQAAVFEDALAGVEAGRAGHFGIVVGVNRVGHREALRAHGADIVVDDLSELLESP